LDDLEVGVRLSFFVVFDTCTHARYYGDVHEVLALPQGAVIRYEYKRRLFKPDAAQTIENLVLTPSQLPMPVLLMYGEKSGFVQGSGDPPTMLTIADSVFVPTRSANVISVAIDNGPTSEDDVFYLHLELRGFVDPDSPEIRELIATLEAANSLPFGIAGTQQTWISLLPASIFPRRDRLINDEPALWPRVIDKLVTLPTQFQNDVFWRVRSLFEEKDGARSKAVDLVDRSSNLRVDPHSWQRDYPLLESSRYVVEVQTYSPHDHGGNVPGGSTVALTSIDDDQGLLKLSPDPLPIVPNQVAEKRFSVTTDSALGTRYIGMRLETQVPNHTSQFPAGSMCTLTFSIRKDRSRFFLGILLVLVSIGLGAYVADAKPSTGWTVIDAIAGALILAVGVWLMTQQFKIGGGGK
jgi:hypothetical protein